MGDGYRLVAFDAENLPPAGVVAELHSKLLPTSPAVKLGTGFLESFYYKILVQVGSVQGAVAWVDENPAGFIVTTNDSTQFMSNALKQRFFEVAAAGASALLKRPTRIVAVIETLRLMNAYESQQPDDPEGEILSMGIEEEYRSSDFTSETGHKIAIDLLDLELDRLRRSGRKRVRAVVDTSNVAAQFFYRGLGWSLERDGVPGWHTPTVEFLLDL